MSNGPPGPLGILPGLTFDPITNRYYSTPKVSNPSTPSSALNPSSSSSASASASGTGSSRYLVFTPDGRVSRDYAASGVGDVAANGKAKGRVLPPTGCPPEGKRFDKRIKLDPSSLPVGEMSDWLKKRATRGLRSHLGTTRSRRQDHLEFSRQHFSSLNLTDKLHCGGTHTGEVITSVKAFPGGSMYATTEHGRVIFHRSSGKTHFLQICAQTIVDLHMDLARMTTMAISTGSDAHIHYFKRDPVNLFQIEHSEIGLPSGEVFAKSSFDDTCTLGAERGITCVDYTKHFVATQRRLKSDCLSLDHQDKNLVFCGLRNSSILLEDLRVSPRSSYNVIAKTVKGKAVVGVKKLQDSAVPWGVAVSGMSDEIGEQLVIFDARFGKDPLHTLEGHINNYRRQLGMTTTPDDSYIFHAGSDHRIRAWSTRTGQRLLPPQQLEEYFPFTSPASKNRPQRDQPTASRLYPPSRFHQQLQINQRRRRRRQSGHSSHEWSSDDEDDEEEEEEEEEGEVTIVDTPGPGGDMSRILDEDDDDDEEQDSDDEGDEDRSSEGELLSFGTDDSELDDSEMDEIFNDTGDFDVPPSPLLRSITRPRPRPEARPRSQPQSHPRTLQTPVPPPIPSFPSQLSQGQILGYGLAGRASGGQGLSLTAGRSSGGRGLSLTAGRIISRPPGPNSPPGNGVTGRISSSEDNPLRRVFHKRVLDMSFHVDSWDLDVAVGDQIERFTVREWQEGI